MFNLLDAPCHANPFGLSLSKPFNRLRVKPCSLGLFLGAILLLAIPVGAQNKLQDKFEGIGRTATPREVAAWDIDVRPDFKGLPAGSGSVQKGQDVWEAKCASCHGIFAESNSVFSPLVGGTTAQDVQSGNVAALQNNAFPGRTTLMKLPTLSTLWDYIHRAMPWNAPKSLSVEEVYAVTAFMLNLGGVVPDDFTLANTNMAQVQALLPNRKGMTTAHALWPGDEKGGEKGGAVGRWKQPDVKALACMRDCKVALEVVSSIPDFARNAHGNLSEQNRLVGAQRGVETTAAVLAKAPAPPPVTATASALATSPAVVTAPSGSAGRAAPASDGKAALALANKYSCTGCHAMAQKILGPAFADIAKRYPGQTSELAQKIVKGSTGVWGSIPMPPQAINTTDAMVLAQWLAAGAAR